MAEIINWLRGGDIFIITLVRRNNQENKNGSITAFFPESLLITSPDFTQWIVRTTQEAQSALGQIINQVSNEIKTSQENEYGLDVDSNLIYAKENDELKNTIPDCVLAVDLMGLGNTDTEMSLLTKEDYDSLYYRFYGCIRRIRLSSRIFSGHFR